jgi:hypothetical protein
MRRIRGVSNYHAQPENASQIYLYFLNKSMSPRHVWYYVIFRKIMLGAMWFSVECLECDQSSAYSVTVYYRKIFLYFILVY